MVKALRNHIVETKQKSGSSNKLCYCKACFIKLGENSNELKMIVDKTEHILQHFNDCQNFHVVYSQEEKFKIIALNNNNDNNNNTVKRKSNYF